MPLSSIPIVAQLNWLPINLQEAPSALPGLPLGYDAYIKVLPPLGIDPDIPIASYSFAKRTIAELNARAAFWDKYGIQQGQPDATRLKRTSYGEVGATIGLAYTAALDSSAIQRFYGEWPPHLGSSSAFEKVFIQQLVQLLGPESPAYFYGSIEEGTYHWDEHGFPQDWLEQGSVADLLLVYQRDNKLPTYLFPADHSWCFYQGETMDWVAIGCSASLAQALLNHPDLEAIPV